LQAQHGAGTTAGFAGRRTATRATLITTQISGIAVLPGTNMRNGDLQRLTFSTSTSSC
jgi:hypothetical protein